jgi:hypothetical protein
VPAATAEDKEAAWFGSLSNSTTPLTKNDCVRRPTWPSFKDDSVAGDALHRTLKHRSSAANSFHTLLERSFCQLLRRKCDFLFEMAMALTFAVVSILAWILWGDHRGQQGQVLRGRLCLLSLEFYPQHRFPLFFLFFWLGGGKVYLPTGRENPAPLSLFFH